MYFVVQCAFNCSDTPCIVMYFSKCYYAAMSVYIIKFNLCVTQIKLLM